MENSDLRARLDALLATVQEMRGEIRADMAQRVLSAVYTVEMGSVQRAIDQLRKDLDEEEKARITGTRAGASMVAQYAALVISVAAFAYTVLSGGH